MTHEVAMQLVEGLRKIRSRVRIKEKAASPYAWDWPLFSPSVDYLETGTCGPVALVDIEAIDIEKEEKKHSGSLVSPLTIDHSSELEALFRSQGLIFEPEDSYIRINT